MTLFLDVVDVEVADEVQQMLEAMLVKVFRADVGRVVVGRDVVYRKASFRHCLLYTSPSPRDKRQSRMPSSA